MWKVSEKKKIGEFDSQILPSFITLLFMYDSNFTGLFFERLQSKKKNPLNC